MKYPLALFDTKKLKESKFFLFLLYIYTVYFLTVIYFDKFGSD